MIMIAAQHPHFNSSGIALKPRSTVEETPSSLITRKDQRERYHNKYVHLLQESTMTKSFTDGKWAHAHILADEFQPNTFLWNTLVNMYSKCGSLIDARDVFERVPYRNVFTWTAMIGGYAKQGQSREALNIFKHMNQDNTKPDRVTFICVLTACSSIGTLEIGKWVHSNTICSACGLDGTVANTLIDMYAKCGSIESARIVFEHISIQDTVSWNILISGYIQYGICNESLNLFNRMYHMGVTPNKVTIVSVLTACVSILNLEQGKLMHTYSINAGCESDSSVGNALIDMYGKCGNIDYAQEVFRRLSIQDVVSWTSLISAHVQHGNGKEALLLYFKMKYDGFCPNKVTFITILSVDNIAMEQSKLIHSHAIVSEFESDVLVGNGIIDAYTKSGSLLDAFDVFNRMAAHDVISWNILMAAYCRHGDEKSAFQLFVHMQNKGFHPNKATFISALTSCACLHALQYGKLVHANLSNSGYINDDIIVGPLIDMYSRCGSLADARFLFDRSTLQDMVIWTAMITGCAFHGDGREAVHLFWRMKREGVPPDQITLTSVLNACAKITSMGHGKQVHAFIIQEGQASDSFLGNTLVGMYSKCGSMNSAAEVFDTMWMHDAISWNAMVTGYAQNREKAKTCKIFAKMNVENMKPDDVTFANVLGDFSYNLVHGRWLHAYILRDSFSLDIFLGNALMDMYSKSGSISDAQQVFEMISGHDVISWTTMIAGFIQAGDIDASFNLFEQMQRHGIRPDKVTCIQMLSACCSIASLGYGRRIHCHIRDARYEMDISLGNALVDMYSNCGLIEDARHVFDGMLAYDVVSWNSMMSGYVQHGQGKDALVLFDKMQKGGSHPNEVTYVSVLSACAYEDLVDEGFNLLLVSYERCISLTGEHYICVIDLLGRGGHLNLAWDFIDAMPLQPNAALWMAFLAICKKYDNIELAQYIAERTFSFKLGIW